MPRKTTTVKQEAIEEVVAVLPDTSPVDVSDLADDIETIRHAKAEIKKWEDVLDAARDKIKGRMGHHEEGVIDGVVVVSWKWRQVTRLDHGAIRASVDPEVLKHFERHSAERRFEVRD